MSQIKNHCMTESGEFNPDRIGYPGEYEQWLTRVQAENLAEQMANETLTQPNEAQNHENR